MTHGTKGSSLAVGLALAGLLAIGPAAAGGPAMGHGHPGHGGEPMMHLLSQLDLNDAQKTQVHAIFEDEHPKMQPLMEASRKAHLALAQAIHAPTFDENAIRAAAAQAGSAEGELSVEKGRMISRIRAVLSSDQQKKMDALHEEMASRHAAWGGAPEEPSDSE